MTPLPLLLALLSPGAEPAPRFRLESAAGETTAGAVERLGADWSVTLAGSKPVPGGDVVSLRRADAVPPAWPRDGRPPVL